MPTTPRKRRRRVSPLAFLLALLILAGGLLILFTPSRGAKTPEALAQTYAKAMARDRVGRIYRLFPKAITGRYSGPRAAFVEEMDEFCYAYGQANGYTLVSVTEYEEPLRQTFSEILDTEIADYRHITLSMAIDGRERLLHLDSLQIKNRWYLSEVWNDDVLIGTGFASPEEAMEAYASAFEVDDLNGISVALAPALTEAAVEKQYGLRQMLCEVDDLYAAGLSGESLTYTLTETKDYSPYQAQSMAEVLGEQPQAYRAYYYDACVGDTVYTLVVDMVQMGDRWGITRVWDYLKEYMI